ncbi:HAD superfamily protein, putative [Plasmodium gallinaceum]|uniref:phosphatidate phosphatase n=1 Tax=Plasmodium gallinaceum TaxID=5849 RepID=A0A1J1GS53_PLAGA|nr:HAD superfamily protein, putative [Plasmodium gallinaceum]CRG95260.1 HAD superfamily protein, putative [Plasmodium gallinaceum]
MWGKIVSSVSNALDFNQATLSGCIDIICIESEIVNSLKNDKIEVVYKSTPFHVRFGKTKLLRSKEKIVSILVNGKSTNLHMKLGSAGEAYFVEKTYEDVEEELETSPLSSPRNEYNNQNCDQHIDSCSVNDSVNNYKIDEDCDQIFINTTEGKKLNEKNYKVERNKVKKNNKEKKKKNEYNKIDEEEQKENIEMEDEELDDEKKKIEDEDQNVNSEWSWSWGRLPHLKTHDYISDNCTVISSNNKNKKKEKLKKLYKKSESVNEHTFCKEKKNYINKRNLSEINIKKNTKKDKEIKNNNLNNKSKDIKKYKGDMIDHFKKEHKSRNNKEFYNKNDEYVKKECKTIDSTRRNEKNSYKTEKGKINEYDNNKKRESTSLYQPVNKDNSKEKSYNVDKESLKLDLKKIKEKEKVGKKSNILVDDYYDREEESNEEDNNHFYSKEQEYNIDDDIQNRIECSLCGHLLINQNADNEHNDYSIEIHNKNIFEANIVTYDQIDKNSNLWYHPSLVFRFDKKDPYYPSRVALPLLASWVVFNQPLSILAVEKLLNSSLTLMEIKDKSWRNWFGVSNAEYDNSLSIRNLNKDTKEEEVINENKKKEGKINKNDFNESLDIKNKKLKKNVQHLSYNENEIIKKDIKNNEEKLKVRYRKSLRPTSEQLQSLNLKEGANTITFLVTSSLQGTKSINGTIYLWKKNAKIVISDVDGTITRSTVLGHIMPIVGKDWSHVGVSQLFNKINNNGYHILYLTARAIGQADSTREYLFRLKRNDNNKLPDGPLILSPDRLFPSFKREVIDKKPYIFKIAALRDIRNLFPINHNPFYAAFGNTESDHRAYISVGVPEAKVFIIDNRGIVHHVNSTYAKTYETMSEITEHMFPCIKNDKKREDDDQYNSFQYWKINSLTFYEKYMNISDSN